MGPLANEQPFQSSSVPQGFRFYVWQLWLGERSQGKFRFVARAMITAKGSGRITGWADGEGLPHRSVTHKPADEGMPSDVAFSQTWLDSSPDWDRLFDTAGDKSASFDIKLLEAATVKPGMSVLDLASGAGNPAISLARQAGSDGRVLATDLVPDVLLGTLRCAVENGLPNLCCCAADMQQLPFPAGCFDRVVCRFGIMFSPELAQALAEIKRVLKSGGQAAFLVWGALAENTAFDVLHRIVGGFLGRENAGEAPLPFRYGAPGSLSVHLQRAGFERVTEQAIHFSTTTPPGMRFWDAQLEMNYGAAMNDLPTSLSAALNEQIEAAFEPYRSGAGYCLAGHVRLITGRLV